MPRCRVLCRQQAPAPSTAISLSAECRRSRYIRLYRPSFLFLVLSPHRQGFCHLTAVPLSLWAFGPLGHWADYVPPVLTRPVPTRISMPSLKLRPQFEQRAFYLRRGPGDRWRTAGRARHYSDQKPSYMTRVSKVFQIRVDSAKRRKDDESHAGHIDGTQLAPHNRHMNQEHFDLLGGTAEDLAVWHRDHSPEQLDLKGADLSGRDLRGRNFTRALLDGADLSGANLDEAVFTEAKLRGANLSGASMKKATLLRANCAGADLTGVDLRGATLYRCVLRDATITGANFKAAILFKVAWPQGVDVPARG
ncbi:MAG: pentapeptide repeat-containing protein [Chloroflexi bacterium]|nr:pentapeptide repeat-containing protein [Chloroflexota bacterium]